MVVDARNKLINDYDWTITDNGLPEYISPIIDPPGDIVIEAGVKLTIGWNVSDAHPRIYNIYQNGSLISEDLAWSNGTHTY